MTNDRLAGSLSLLLGRIVLFDDQTERKTLQRTAQAVEFHDVAPCQLADGRLVIIGASSVEQVMVKVKHKSTLSKLYIDGVNLLREPTTSPGRTFCAAMILYHLPSEMFSVSK